MKILLAVALMVMASSVNAAYFKVLGFGSPVEQSAALLLDPEGKQSHVAVTDIALVTHSIKDGTIMPLACRDSWCPPESWSPLSVGGGIAFNGDKVINLDTSVNIAPQLAALTMARVNTDSPTWLQVLKKGLDQSGAAKIRVGWAEMGYATRNGVFQSAKEAFPGCGLFDIAHRAGRIAIGVAWTY